jgi:2-aminoethylphosphonate-pyruvate transaminase
MQKLLFTPGPLTTSRTVKEAMLEDMGSRDYEFMNAVKEIRNDLLRLGGIGQEDGYECVIMQGSGTFCIESVISSVVGRSDSLLVMVNGAYGERIAKMAVIQQIKHQVARFGEDEIITGESTEKWLKEYPETTHLVCVHSETTTGLLNPVKRIGQVCKQHKVIFIVDAMSSFGGVEMDMKEMKIDFLVSSSNKCIEGVPGFAFALCNRKELEKSKGLARSLSLDLFDQWNGLETNGQFRFTPPTLSIMAFRQALRELEKEGGVKARQERYKANKAVLDEGMARLGFKEYLQPSKQGHIITAFLYPDHRNFEFERFYKKLNDRGLVIYPGKLSKVNAFRIGNIGHLFPADFKTLVAAIEEILEEESIQLV